MTSGGIATAATTDDSPDEGLPIDAIRFAALDAERRTLLLNIHELLEEISYGSVVIVLQDGRVIQMETSEKIRLR
ncbi:MAG: putative small protein [Actinomycetota bacterium]|jgi:hypothetical protein|nr:putative small protein [Actinomycetota bacterium]